VGNTENELTLARLKSLLDSCFLYDTRSLGGHYLYPGVSYQTVDYFYHSNIPDKVWALTQTLRGHLAMLGDIRVCGGLAGGGCCVLTGNPLRGPLLPLPIVCPGTHCRWDPSRRPHIPLSWGGLGGTNTVVVKESQGRHASGLSYNLENRKVVSRISGRRTGAYSPCPPALGGGRRSMSHHVVHLKACDVACLQPRVERALRSLSS
jgi:hypothetical protein